ncbi:hypothetical protein GBZ48_13685 [Azospirillum melinis]|uniref:Uncharacterized protein n=1 Tax=Azospirillum melinis TaxID=328839 RepID=A0ABX2KKL7_9PROT|nr:hypothetical protein [Azospirillum melinis]MBP2307947.1 hypothetical protein [Azospirillum melinis]NUB00339.1 hypothetical protein [Azospirillum melinis]
MGQGVERVLMLLFMLNQGGPTTLEFASMEQCKAAEPIIIQNYREMTGNTVLSRCIRMTLPAK